MNKQTILTILFGCMIICIFFGGINDTMKSNGGPPYNTKAPGEKTCSGSEGSNSCHSGGIADNAGLAGKSISFSGGTTYVPGQTYTVTISISHPTYNRFGFQIVSLRNSNSANAGTATITDAARTQSQIPTYGSYQTRNYVMHVLNGSYGTSNQDQWSYQWKAPSADQGGITFYACFLAANNNATNDSGDETYFTSLTINCSTAGIASTEKNISDIVISPNPVKDIFCISYTLKESSYFKADLIDMEGRTIRSLIGNKNTAAGSYKENIQLENKIAPGLYFIQFSSGDQQFSRRIIIE